MVVWWGGWTPRLGFSRHPSTPRWNAMRGGGSEIMGVRVSTAVKKQNEGADLVDGNIQGTKSII